MTIDEALGRLRGAGPCFVVFDAETGEVLEIHAEGAARTADEVAATLRMDARAAGPVKGRFVDGATVTREELEAEVTEARAVRERIALFSRWVTSPPGELVRLLEARDFGAIDVSTGAKLVLDRLFDHPRDVLEPFVPRLERLVAADELPDAVRRLLDSRLAVLAGDFPRLRRAWEHFDPETFTKIIWHPELLRCLGDLEPCPPEAIERLIETVSSPDLMFGFRCEAMRSLGRIGAAAGPRAVGGIRATVRDSTDEIVALRERVLARLETPADAWTRCPRCSSGRIPDRPWHAPRECPTCLGLAFVPRG